jgi:hypothetical protein
MTFWISTSSGIEEVMGMASALTPSGCAVRDSASRAERKRVTGFGFTDKSLKT